MGIAAGAVAAVLLRTSPDDALTLHRGESVDVAFTAHLDPPVAPGAATPDGRYLLVVFGYTSCPDICPTTLQAVHRALERLGAGAERVVPIFVTVDPSRDTAQRLQPYVNGFDARIRSISNPGVVAATLRTFHARAEKQPFPSGDGYGMDHTAVLYVLSPDRHVIAALPEAAPTLSEDLVAVLQHELGASRPADAH